MSEKKTWVFIVGLLIALQASAWADGANSSGGGHRLTKKFREIGDSLIQRLELIKTSEALGFAAELRQVINANIIPHEGPVYEDGTTAPPLTAINRPSKGEIELDVTSFKEEDEGLVLHEYSGLLLKEGNLDYSFSSPWLQKIKAGPATCNYVPAREEKRYIGVITSEITIYIGVRNCVQGDWDVVNARAISKCRIKGGEDCKVIKTEQLAGFYGRMACNSTAQGDGYKVFRLSDAQIHQKTCDLLAVCEQNYLNNPSATPNDINKLNSIIQQHKCR